MSDSNAFRKRKPFSGTSRKPKTHQKLPECEKPGESSVKWIFIAILVGGLWVIIILPSPIEPETFTLPHPPKFEDALAPNDVLTKSTRILENQIKGPESIAIKNGKIYTGTADGKIVSIDRDGHMKTVARLGVAPCGKVDDEPTCGRPLGLRFDKDGSLVIADSYLGLFRVNVETGRVTLLKSSKEPFDGIRPAFLNDLDIAKDGKVYFTDSSAKWSRRDNRYLIMDAVKDGRVMVYNPVDESIETLIHGMMFPNGITLSRDNDYFLVVELIKCRILKHYLKGRNAGKVEVFADNLPGVPDNIRPSKDGGYWVAMAVTRSDDRFSFIDYTASKPWIKKLLMKVFDAETLVKLSPRYGLIIELNSHGEIVRSFHDPTGVTVPSASEVEQHGNTLYIGSYYLPYISKLVLNSTTKDHGH